MNRIEVTQSNNEYPLHYMRKKSDYRIKLVNLKTDTRVDIKLEHQMRRAQMKFLL